MPTRVITVTSGKGGVGKTTVTANLGGALSELGRRVVVIDADIGLRNLDMVMGLQNRIVYDMVDLVEGRCRLGQALIRHDTRSELYLLPAAQSRDKTAISPADMVRVCEQLRGACDFVLVDSPAGIETGFRNAIAAADGFILITTPDIPAVRDVDRVLGILEDEGYHDLFLVINRMRPELVQRGKLLSPAEVQRTLTIDLIGIIPEAKAIVASRNQRTLIARDKSSLAGRAYMNAARRLLGQDVRFLSLLEGKNGIMQQFASLFRGR